MKPAWVVERGGPDAVVKEDFRKVQQARVADPTVSFVQSRLLGLLPNLRPTSM